MRTTLNRNVCCRPAVAVLLRLRSPAAACALFASLIPAAVTAQSAGPIEPHARIVTLGGSVTETVFALGFGDQVVAVDGSSLYPAEVTDLPQVGYYRTLSVEGLLSLRPDLVIGAAASGPTSVLQMIQSAGVRVERIDDAYDPEQSPANIERIAGILGVPERGAELAARVRADFERVASLRTGIGPGVSAVFVWSRGGPGLQVAGSETNAHTMLELAGIRNAAAELRGYQPFDAEAMLLANPDVLIVPAATAEGLGGLDALLRMPGVAPTTAARTGHVVVVDLLAFIGFGPRAGEALLQLLDDTQRPTPAAPGGSLGRR